ncbi:carbohydrate-binding module family 1 protein [Cadophora sp. DSE1049]|nr:carbohydrate-binding module family 1 protein [Cadophora sp. DSE1049]
MPLISTIARALAIGAAFLPVVRAGFDPRSSNNVVVYWGQNSYGAAEGPLMQQRLSHYCKDEKLDIIPLAFLTNMANPESLNFANRSPSEQGCADVGRNDIKECQEVYGKTIVLSLGGEITHGSGFASEAEAVQKAQKLWAAFGPPGALSANRKFGNAVIDGFDFDNEKPLSNMVPFARELRRQMSESSKKDGKKYLLTAAPQCPFPDQNVGPLLSSDVPFDAVFIQFYNNPGCSAKAFVSGVKKQPGFNFETWQNWAKQSKNPNVKVMVGVPSTPNAAGSGFISGEKLAEIVAYCKRFSNFGGVMFWDMTQAWSAPDILSKARAALGGSNPDAFPSPTPGQVMEIEVVWEKKEPEGLVHEWNQCDGKDWHGGHTCEDDLFCQRLSDWYSHCVSSGFRGQ